MINRWLGLEVEVLLAESFAAQVAAIQVAALDALARVYEPTPSEVREIEECLRGLNGERIR